MERRKQMLEKEIESYFDWVVERSGGRTYKFRSPAQRGVADRIACMPNGTTWFVELKKPSGRLSKLQGLFAEDMRCTQQQYACLWTKEQVDEWFTTTSLTPTPRSGCGT
jgi:hypothetical protein